LEITYLKHNQIDKAKWDECINHSPNRIVYAQSWYLDVVSKGWEALVAADYETVMPLTHGNKYGITYLFQPFFTQQLGVFSRKEANQNLVDMFLNSIPAKFKFIDIALNKGNNCQLGEFQTKNNVNYELKLDKSYSEIAKGYSSNTKRNINKAAQNKLSVILDVSTAKLIQLFRNNLGKGIKNIKDGHYQLLKQIMDRSLLELNGEIYGVNSNDGKLCAGAFFLKSYDSFIFLFSATNDESKENGAMFLIIDQFIRKHADEKIILDFEGSNIKSLARFYKSFGADEFNYLRIKKNNLPRLLRLFKS
jgi:hypothetical protein